MQFVRAVFIHSPTGMTKMMGVTLHAALADEYVTSTNVYSISKDIAQGLLYLHSIQSHLLIHHNMHVNVNNVL